MVDLLELAPYAVLGVALGGGLTVAASLVAQALPQYEIRTQFDQGQILPYHTQYFITDEAGGEIKPNLVQGCHNIVEDEGVKVLRVHSDSRYMIGFGDPLWGYGPPGTHEDPTWDISNRVCGQPLDYFDYVPGGPPSQTGRPYVPAYWQFELTAFVKPIPKTLKIAFDQWTYWGLSEVNWYGNSQGVLVWRENGGLGYGYGNFPEAPYGVKLIDNLQIPDGYFMIRLSGDFRGQSYGTAGIEWAGFKETVPLVRERVGYGADWPHFYNHEIILLEPGDLLVKSVNIRFWNKVAGGPTQPEPY